MGFHAPQAKTVPRNNLRYRIYTYGFGIKFAWEAPM